MELALKTTATMGLRSEQALVEAARRGDDRAFEQLYAQYREQVTGFIQSKVRDHGRAEDISQEVFMAALRQLRSHDRDIAFRPWIYAIAKNACIDEFRRSARGREVPVEADDDLPTDQRAALSIVPSPPAAIETKQRLADLRGAFGGLSESHHRLLVMRELEGRSYDEIGNRLGMTRQMVESSLFRARRKLSAEYEELASGRRCEQVQTVVDSGAVVTLRALGIKERRRLTQHLSHCQACRHHARLAGIDENLLKPRSIAAKIGALLPFGGLWRWPWRRGGSAAARAHTSGQLAASGAAQAVGTAGSSVTLGQAAAAVAALAIAGGGGIAIAQHGQHGDRTPAPAHHVRTGGAAATGGGANAVPANRAAGGLPRAAATGTSAAHTLNGRPTAKGSKTRSTALGSGTKLPAPASGQQPPTGSAGSPTSSTSSPSSANPTSNLLNTTINRPGQPLSKVTAPIKKTVDPITKATDPVTGTVNKVLSSPPVKSVTAPVTGTVNKVLSSPPVKSVTAPVTGTVNKVLSSPPVKSVTAPVTGTVNKVLSSPPVKGITGPVTSGTNPVTSSPPVKAVGGTVQKVLAPPGTTPSSGAGSTGGSGSSSGSGNPVTTVTKVIGGL